ncbi:MAG: prepilin-type N-terminal cleavage/methylation domain-containing protein [Verrucomicrobiota bacterium]
MNAKSKKGFTLVEIMIVVVIIGLLAAMAIPAFNKVREQSREKAITNNLRQVASAGQQYILEEGTDQATYAQLQPTYFNTIAPVAGEDYTGLIVDEEGGSLSVTTGGGLEVTYTY